MFLYMQLFKNINRDFPGDLVVKMLPNAGSAGSIPGQETKIPTYHAAKKKKKLIKKV